MCNRYSAESKFWSGLKESIEHHANEHFTNFMSSVSNLSTFQLQGLNSLTVSISLQSANNTFDRDFPRWFKILTWTAVRQQGKGLNNDV